MSKISKNDVQKSLAKLQSLAKSQLYSTPSDSAPASWAGTTSVDQDEHEDKIDENGTDYGGVRKSLANKVRKSLALTPAEVAIAEGRNPLPAIGEKVAKGQKLTAAENWAIKGGFDAKTNMFKGTDAPSESVPAPGTAEDPTSVPDSHAGEKEDEIEADAKKSLNGAIQASENLSKGLELSPFLADFASAFVAALEGAEARITKSLTAKVDAVVSTLTKSIADQDEFNKSLATAVSGLGQLTLANSKEAVQAAQAPVGPPKSQLRAIQGGDLSKSIGPGGMNMDLNKSQIVDAMVDLVKSNKLPAQEVVKFESTGQLADPVRHLIQQHVAGAR